ncbi:MAG TPA: DUF6526 family protein [Vicinamibacterales bacterium]
MAETQTYANHAHRPIGWTITALLAVLAFAGMVLFVLRTPSVLTFALLMMAGAVVGVVVLVRWYATRLQDRIIRLEMRVRLAGLGREHDLTRLTVRQLVALRFASDAELGTLVDRALADNLTSDQIKRAITNWQADRMRT